MFTGIIQAKGTVTALERHDDNTVTLALEAPAHVLEGLATGGSLAVSGVCLTAINEIDTSGEAAEFRAVAMGETLERTSLGQLREGSEVNLERCTRVGDRLDGHIVQGHVDGVGRLLEIDNEGSWARMRFSTPERLAEQIAEKGSIAVDGISLTVSAVSDPAASEHWFEVALIPETLEVTTLGGTSEGMLVNLETDVIAKYSARLVSVRAARGTLDVEDNS